MDLLQNMSHNREILIDVIDVDFVLNYSSCMYTKIYRNIC